MPEAMYKRVLLKLSGEALRGGHSYGIDNPTLTKIARALGVHVTAFFDSEPIATSADRCPVSNSGRCVMDQLLVGRGRRPSSRLVQCRKPILWLPPKPNTAS